MNINARLASIVPDILARNGFEITLQQSSAGGGDFDTDTPEWSNLATVKAVWDTPRVGRKGVNDGAPHSEFQRQMTIAYREGLKDTSTSVKLRVLVDGVIYNVLSVANIGDKVGNRLYVDAGA